MSKTTTALESKAKSYLDEIEKILHDFLNPEQDMGQLRKREQILNSATTLFVSHGYRKTSMEEIALEAGVAKGTVYLYYRNKAELLFHAVALQNQSYMDELASALDPALSPVSQLHRLVSLSITLSQKAPLLARMTSGDREITLVLREVDDDLLMQVNRMKIDFITQLLDAATKGKLDTTTLEKKAMVLIDLIFAVVSSQRWTLSEMSATEYADLVADFIIRGILATSTTGAQLSSI